MLVPIACRFIPYDQWFVTHLDDKWKVKQVKHWILAKCNLLQSPGPHIQRSVSPITFAPSVRSRSSLESVNDGYNEDDEYSDQESPPATPSKHGIYPRPDIKSNSSSQSTQTGNNPLVDRYTLMSFSTGTMLEDEFTLSWYNLRPFELLEMHPSGTVAPLQRDVLAEYIQPYFQAKVRVLRVVWDHRSGRFETPSIDIPYEHNGYVAKDKLAHTFGSLSPKSSSSQLERKRKTKVNWKARWVVINHGILSLCKEHVTSPALHQFALSSMTALRGTDALERAFPITAQPRVVCIKFRPRSALLTSVVSPPPSIPSSPTSEDLKSSAHEPLLGAGSASDCKQTGEQEDRRDREGEWVILDMLDDHAFSSILRILHREALHPISSSFAPSSSIVAVSSQSPAMTSFNSYETIPYPEWRIHTVENARKAGMGDVGKPMAWVLWTEKGVGESLMGNIRQHRQAFLHEMQYRTAMIPSDIYGTDNESDEESEMEWEGWMRDLDRQGQVKQRPEVVWSRQTRMSGSMSSSSQLPSPPPSEGSPSSSPRARSSSLSMPRAGAGSFAAHSHSQYPNIGNIIGAYGNRNREGYSREKIKSTTVSTVSVGKVPSSRRRSSTISEVGMPKSDKGKKGRERFSSTSPNSTRTNAQTMPSSSVRHAHSSSNLRTASLLCESDVAESVSHPVPSSTSKRHGAFMRGMSLRAGKLVKGLESAIDFVDG